MTKVQINQVLNEQFPTYIRDNYQKFIEFIQQYYISQEYEGGTADLIQNLTDYVSADTFDDPGFGAESYLTQDIQFYDDTIFVTSVLGWPDSFGLLKIDNEIISYTGISTSQSYEATVTVPTSFGLDISFFNANNGIVPEVFNQLSIGDVVIVNISAIDFDGVEKYIEVLEINGDEIITSDFYINFHDLDKGIDIIRVPANRLKGYDENLFVGAKLFINKPLAYVDGNISNLYSGQLGVEITLKGNLFTQSFSSNIVAFEGCQRGFGALDLVGQNINQSQNTSSDYIQFVQTEAADHKASTRVYNLTNLFKEEILKGLKKTFAPGFEDRKLVPGLNQANFIRQISDLYKSKGSEASFDLLFQSLYGKPVTVSSNYDEVIRPSDAVYVKGRVITLEALDPFTTVTQITNTTLEQPEYVGYCSATSAVVGSATIAVYGSQKYFQLFLTNETVTNPNIESDVSNLFVVPPQTFLTVDYQGGSTLTVESTLGFLLIPNTDNNVLTITRKSDGYIYKATYEKASSTQFFGVKGLENQTFSSGDLVEVEIKVSCYNQFNRNQKFEFKVKNVISDYETTVPGQYNVIKENVNVVSVGFIPNSKEEVQYNNFIFNNSVSYNTIYQDYNTSTYVLTLDTYSNPLLQLGDVVKIFENSKSVATGTISSITENSLMIQTDGLNVFDPFAMFKIQRQIEFAKSNVWPNVNEYVANVQNNYKSKVVDADRPYVTVFSNSLPSYEIETTDRSEQFYGTGIQPTPFLTLIDTAFLTGDSVQFGKLNGFEINYYLEKDPQRIPFTLNESDFYIIEKINDNQIRLYNDRSSIEGGNYFVFFSNDTLGQFSLTPSRLYNTELSGQNLVRYIPNNFEVGIRTSGSLYERKPGGVGLLANGVELISNTSIFSISYGEITRLNLVRGGSGYDVLNPPKLFVSAIQGSIEGSAICNVGVTGSLSSINIFSDITGWLQVPAVYITGGGGIGAKAECILSGITTARKIETINVTDPGSGYKNKPIFVDPSNIDLFNNVVNYSNHPFKNGDIVHYSLSDPLATPIQGLSQNTNYYVIYLSDNKFSLASDLNNLALRIPVTFGSSGSQYNIFNFEPIVVTITGITGYGATSVSQNDLEVNFRGSITDGFITYPGVGYGSSTILSYEKDPFVTVTSGNNAVVGVDAIVNGSITSVRIVDPGQNYTTTPTLRVIGSGTGAVLTATVSNGSISSVTIQSGGIGYDIQDTIVQVVPVGSDARITAQVQTWSIDLPSRHFNTLAPDWGFLRLPNNINIDNTSQYTTFLLPVQLRQQLGEKNLSEYGVQTALPYVHSPLVGWAYDGNPIYGPYGFSDPFDKESPVKLLNSSYQFSPSANRPDAFLTNSGIGTTTGFFVEDWVYVDGYGELDVYNGRFCVTPEYPNGIYAYFATYEGNSYIGVIPITTNNGLENYIPVNYSTRDLYPTVECLLNNSEVLDIPSYNSHLVDKWDVWNNNNVVLEINYNLGGISIPTFPVYPYVIGNFFKNQPDSRNLLVTSTQDKVNPNNLIRNSWPYQLFEPSVTYDYINYKQNLSQQILVDRISTGIITGFNILDGGTGYKVGNAIQIDNRGTQGGGASARVKSVTTTPINSLTYETRSLPLQLAYKGGTVVGMTSTPHLLRDGQYLTIENVNFSNFSFIQGSHKVSVSGDSSQLMYSLGSISQTGIITTISLTDNPNSLGIEYNSILGIGTGLTLNTDIEQLLVLNVYPTQNSVRVLRAYNGSTPVGFAQTGNEIRVLSNTFEYQTGFTTSAISNNNTVTYFEPDVTTSIGSSIFVISNHGYKAGQRINYSPTAPGQIGINPVIVNSSGSSIPLNSVPEIYVNYLNEDAFSLSTTPLTSGTESNPSILTVVNLGSDSWQHNFTTTYPQLTGQAVIYDGVINTPAPSANQLLNLDNTINVNVAPLLTEVVHLSFGSTSGRLYAGISTFTSNDINITLPANGLITIPDHGLQTGDPLEFYGNFTINTNTDDGQLLNYQQYFAIFIDNNTIALAESFLTATSIPAQVIDFTSIVGTGSAKLSKINPRIDALENSLLILDVSDVSFREINFGLESKALTIYRDQFFTESLNPFGTDGQTPAIINFRTPGEFGASVFINTKLIAENTFYYRLDSTPQKQIVYESNLQPYLNSINSSLSVYQGTFQLTYINELGNQIKFSLPEKPEALIYDSLNTDSLNFSVNESNVVGSIASIELVSKGSNFKALPGYSINGGTGGKLEVLSSGIGIVDDVQILDNSFIYSSDPTLVPIGETPIVIQLYNLNNVGLKTEYIPGELVITETFEGQIIDTNEEIPNFGFNPINQQIIVNKVFGNISVGQTLTGRNSGTTSIVLATYQSQGQFKTSALSQITGRWLTNIGFLNDSTQRIHDNNYYQIFGYSIESEIDYDTWDNPVSSLVHPLGYKKFGKLLINSSADLNLPTNIGETEVSIQSTASWYDYYDWDLGYDDIRNNIYVITRYPINNPLTGTITDGLYVQLSSYDDRLSIPERLGGDERVYPQLVGVNEVFVIQTRVGGTVDIDINDSPIFINSIRTNTLLVQQDNFVVGIGPTDYYRTIKPGDDLQLIKFTPQVYPSTQYVRNFRYPFEDFVAVTPVYDGPTPGIDTSGSIPRPVLWKKQKEDAVYEVTYGYFNDSTNLTVYQSKARPNYSANAYPSSELIAPVSTGSTEIFVKQYNPLNFDASEQIIDIFVSDPINTRPGVGITPFPVVGITSTISNVNAVGDYGKIVGIAQTDLIVQDITLGVGNYVIFRIEIDEDFVEAGITLPRLDVGNYFVTNYTNVGFGTCVSYGVDNSTIVGISSNLIDNVWQCVKICNIFFEEPNSYAAICRGSLGVDPTSDLVNYLELLVEQRNGTEIGVPMNFARITTPTLAIQLNLDVTQRAGNIVNVTGVYDTTPECDTTGYLPVEQQDLNIVEVGTTFFSYSGYNGFYGNYSWGRFTLPNAAEVEFNVNYSQGLNAGLSTAPIASNIVPLI